MGCCRQELPCQRELANLPKIPWFARCLYNKIGQSFVRLLDPQLEDNPPASSTHWNFWRKSFAGMNFHKLVLDHKNLHLAKISQLYNFNCTIYNKCTDHHLLGFLGLVTLIQLPWVMTWRHGSTESAWCVLFRGSLFTLAHKLYNGNSFSWGWPLW